jgi:hypothetical protein
MPRAKGPETKPRKNSPVEAEALRRLSAKGMYPLAPFPGNSTIPWMFACFTCGSVRTRPLKKWQTFGCKGCAKRMPLGELTAILDTGPLSLNGEYRTAKKVPVKCGSCQEQYTADVSSFKNRGKAPCKYCNNKRLSTGEVLKRLARSDFELEGKPPTSSTEQFVVRCKKCHKNSLKTITAITLNKGCKYCAPNAAVEPAEAMSLFLSRNLKPIGEFPGANEGWPSLCLVCGEEPAPHYSSLLLYPDRKCEFCSGKAVNPTAAEQVMRDAKLEPLGPYPGSLESWKCRCLVCGKEPTPTYSAIRGGKRCGFCFPGGVDYALPGILYLIHHSQKGAGKIGIQTYNSGRIASHKRHGWQVVALWLADTGERVHTVEQSVKSKLRFELGATSIIPPSEMPVGGHTETFLTAEVGLNEVESVVEGFRLLRNSDFFRLPLEKFESKSFFEWVENGFEEGDSRATKL